MELSHVEFRNQSVVIKSSCHADVAADKKTLSPTIPKAVGGDRQQMADI